MTDTDNKPSFEESITRCMEKYDGLLRSLADMGPLTVDRIRSEHQLCDATLGNCPFCLLIGRIDMLEAHINNMEDLPDKK